MANFRFTINLADLLQDYKADRISFDILVDRTTDRVLELCARKALRSSKDLTDIALQYNTALVWDDYVAATELLIQFGQVGRRILVVTEAAPPLQARAS